ncbi:E3 ubiquitin-protein ligase TRIM33-like isoform X2 [Dysidea avara]|uniref:E3 ubiquitin-protein ligase TRIM33-like isoform X2 n=1 Tax=Dysidea avara TaxID=196820 RepID=UPI003331781F
MAEGAGSAGLWAETVVQVRLGKNQESKYCRDVEDAGQDETKQEKAVTETESHDSQLSQPSVSEQEHKPVEDDNHLIDSAPKPPITTDQDASNWEKVRQEVTCAICLELLDDPKSMPCLHTYCKKCLMEALAK